VITLCTAVALGRSIEDHTGVVCAYKWPNDLLVGGAKVGGILVEATGDVVTVGCGVNLWWPDSPVFAGAVFEQDPGEGIAWSIAQGWVRRLLETVQEAPDGWPRAAYLQRSWTVGRAVTWDGGSGSATGIAQGGGLIVETGDGEEIITAGEVHVRQER
jgi:BirA family biotin operon repressor/biotin-[acetyl-CoA-carboxylase] ligase